MGLCATRKISDRSTAMERVRRRQGDAALIALALSCTLSSLLRHTTSFCKQRHALTRARPQAVHESAAIPPSRNGPQRNGIGATSHRHIELRRATRRIRNQACSNSGLDGGRTNRCAVPLNSLHCFSGPGSFLSPSPSFSLPLSLPPPPFSRDSLGPAVVSIRTRLFVATNCIHRSFCKYLRGGWESKYLHSHCPLEIQTGEFKSLLCSATSPHASLKFSTNPPKTAERSTAARTGRPGNPWPVGLPAPGPPGP